MAERHQPIIIKKIKKGGGGGHSGGAWKVAYADFVTAMMAFFLLLWLLNSVTQEQLEGISNYFAPASISATKSGAGQVLGGQSVSQPIGTLSDVSQQQAVTVDLPPPQAGQGETPPEDISQQAAEEALKKKEEEQFEQAVKELKNAIENDTEFKDLAKSLIIENTAEGMRIQVADQDGLAMFPSGSAEMYEHTRKVMRLIAEAVKSMPQQISIAGHTDATRFAGGETGYTNWELSADRANASRRALINLGVPPDRISKVVGSAAYEPLLPDDPDNARNRRIAIVLLRGTGTQSAADGGGASSAPGDAASVVPPPSQSTGGGGVPSEFGGAVTAPSLPALGLPPASGPATNFRSPASAPPPPSTTGSGSALPPPPAFAPAPAPATANTPTSSGPPPPETIPVNPPF